MIDYGVGNLFSIAHSLEKVGFDVNVISTSQGLQDLDAIVLPGVGNFTVGYQNLQPLKTKISGMMGEGVPLFGICLGMQLLFETSEEGPGEGLRLLEGKVLQFPKYVKIPHIGWNSIRKIRSNELLNCVDDGTHFHFVHSYYPSGVDEAIIIAETDYGLSFASVVANGKIYGTQFHPEKSGISGERVLRNFADIVKR